MDAGTIILTLVGIGIIVVGILLILQLQKAEVKAGEDAKREVVVRREVGVDIDPVGGSWGWGWAGGWLPAWGYSPYYSRMPVRPLLY